VLFLTRLPASARRSVARPDSIRPRSSASEAAACNPRRGAGCCSPTTPASTRASSSPASRLKDGSRRP